MPDIMPWHLTQLKNPEYTRVDLVKEGANSQAHIKLFKGIGGNTMQFEEFIAKMNPEHAKIVLDHIEKLLKDQETVTADAVAKARKDALEEAANATAIEKATDEESILKSISDPAVRKLMETQIAKTKAAEAMIAKAAAEKLEMEAIAKAKEVSIPGASHEQLADVYKSLADKPEVRETVFGIFKSAAAVSTEGGAFAAIGKSATTYEGGSGDTDAAWGKIEAAAAVHKTAGLGASQAIAKAIQENPELYTQYLKAQQG